MRVSIALVALGLAACTQTASQTANAPAAASSELILDCGNFHALTPESLAQRFGPENIETQTLRGAEEDYEATVVYPNDVARRLEIVWNETRTVAAFVTVDTPGTQWVSGSGYTIDTPIADIERINVVPFKLWGFGWDYGGWVSDWGVGKLSHTLVPGCSPTVRFGSRNEANTSALSSDGFSSNDPAIRDADPVVSEFGVRLAAPDGER